MDTFISEVERLEQFDKQFRGYNIVEVNDRIQELKQEIEKQKEVIQSMEEEMTDLKEQNTLLTKKISVHYFVMYSFRILFSIKGKYRY